MQCDLDNNLLPAVQNKFADTYRAAGSDCRYELFENSEHEWTGSPALRPRALRRWSKPSSRATSRPDASFQIDQEQEFR